MTLGKVTVGATGSTAFNVTGANGPLNASVTTTESGVPVYTEWPTLAPGNYEVRETPVDKPGGRWVRREVRCDGISLPSFTDPLPINIVAGSGKSCVYYNEFQHAGLIRVRKITTGATGTTGFTIRPVDADPPLVYQQRAVTTREDVPVTAVGDSTDQIPIGLYDILETSPAPTDSERWSLESVRCNGIPVGSAQGRVRVRLTADEPEVTCTFTNRFTRTQPQPGPSPTPSPGGGVEGGGEHVRIRAR